MSHPPSGGPSDLSGWLATVIADRRLALRILLVLMPAGLATAVLVIYSVTADRLAWPTYLGLLLSVVLLNGASVALVVALAVRRFRAGVRGRP